VEENIMKLNVNIKRKFKVNGKEYNSIEEMPPDIRNAFKKEAASQAGTGNPLMIRRKIIFNGTEYNSIEEMPHEDRQLYEKVLRAAETGDLPPSLITKGDTSVSEKESKIFVNTNLEKMGRPIKAESVFSPRILILGLVLIALMILIYYLFHVR
jgi:hypothetical protein